MINLRLMGAAGLIGALLLAGAYQAGGNAERKRGDAAELRQQLDTLQADASNERAARQSAEAAQAELTTLNHQKQDELDALRAKLAGLPDDQRKRATRPELDRLYPGAR